MQHHIKATIITDAAGHATGYGLSIEVATSGAADEIRAGFAEGFRLLRQAIEEQLGPIADAPAAPSVPAQPAAPSAPSAQPAAPSAPSAQPAAPQPTTQAPRDPAEAEQRFFARYGALIGGEDWRAVQRYLRSRSPKPTTVAGWIAVAETVRDTSNAQHAPA